MALIVLTYRPSFVNYVPPRLKAPTNRIILALKPRSKAYKQLFSHVSKTVHNGILCMSSILSKLKGVARKTQIRFSSIGQAIGIIKLHSLDRLLCIRRLTLFLCAACLPNNYNGSTPHKINKRSKSGLSLRTTPLNILDTLTSAVTGDSSISVITGILYLIQFGLNDDVEKEEK